MSTFLLSPPCSIGKQTYFVTLMEIRTIHLRRQYNVARARRSRRRISRSAGRCWIVGRAHAFMSAWLMCCSNDISLSLSLSLSRWSHKTLWLISRWSWQMSLELVRNEERTSVDHCSIPISKLKRTSAVIVHVDKWQPGWLTSGGYSGWWRDFLVRCSAQRSIQISDEGRQRSVKITGKELFSLHFSTSAKQTDVPFLG